MTNKVRNNFRVVCLASLFTIMMILAPTLSMPTQHAYAVTSTATGDANVLANALLGGATGIDQSSVSATLQGHQGISSGTYVNPSGTYGIGDGIIISSGNVNSYNDGPSTSSGFTTSFGVSATPEQEALLDPITGGFFNHRDVTQLDISFDMEPGFDTVFFNVVFGSEEFPNFVGSSFIDGFGLYVNGENIAFVDGKPVNINHPDFDFVQGTELTGILTGSSNPLGPHVHTFSKVVGDGAKNNKLTFIISDTSDTVLDTTAWISQLGGTDPGVADKVCFNEDFDSTEQQEFVAELNTLGERTLIPIDRPRTASISYPLPDGWTSPDDPQYSDDHITSVSGFSNYGFTDKFLRNTSGGSFSSIPLEATSWTLTDLPPHENLDISFLLAIIDSWDSDNGSVAPDFFNVKVDGATVFTSTHSIASGSNDYGDINPDSIIVSKEHIGFNGGWRDSAYDMSKEPSLKGIPHTGNDVTIEWVSSGSGWQGGIDESWAIDDVEVCINLGGQEEPKKGGGGMNHWDKRPTFGISHETREDQIVENGFSFNGEYFSLTDNHHTDFAKQSVEIGIQNTFSATVYADKKLKVQEFLFGIPTVGEAHLAELGLEVWYDIDGNIEDVVIAQETDVIDEGTVSVSHEKTKCLSSDAEALCDTTTVSMTFLEPLMHDVMAIKAIDHERRDQRTFLNDGFEISGDSLNPMLTQMIPSNVKNQGLIQVTQLAKYSPYWQSQDGRLFEMNSFGSFKEINRSFERFSDSGNVFTRMHSGFGGLLDYEQNRATNVFDSAKLISDLPDSFGYHFEMTERFNEQLLNDMLEQQEIAKEILKEMDKQTRNH